MLVRTVVAWCVILAGAVANGMFRESVILPRTRRGVAHAISTVLLCVVIVAIGWPATLWIDPRTIQDAWTIGAVWLVLTLAFEFGAGHFVFGRTWQELLADYNLLAGRIWIMVLVVTLMTPIVAFTRRAF
jgi:hypothetical protein